MLGTKIVVYFFLQRNKSYELHWQNEAAKDYYMEAGEGSEKVSVQISGMYSSTCGWLNLEAHVVLWLRRAKNCIILLVIDIPYVPHVYTWLVQPTL